MKNLLRSILILFVISSNLNAAVSNTVKPKPIGKRLKALFLTYNWPEEHKVLMSLLCLQPCTKKNGCPTEVLKYQEHEEKPEVFWNDDFIVIKPIKIGTPQEIVTKFQGLFPDLVSMSGHHSSGFSGNHGSFALESLNIYSSGEELKSVFGSASLVMLNGCNTEVKSNFIGNPMEYIQHIIQDTEVRGSDLPRLRAAISQISGIQKSYRHIYPNACIMGYQGTSIPGGIPQIYGQYANTLRAIYKINEKKELKPRLTLLSGGSYKKNEQRVFKECPAKQWPCNLCKKDSGYYSKLYKSLAKYLRSERVRQTNNRTLHPTEVAQLEDSFIKSRFYKNSKWACSNFSPSTLPKLPNKDNLPKSGKLLLDVLFMPAGSSFSPFQISELKQEILHQLAYIRFSKSELSELRQLVKQENYHTKLVALRKENLSTRSLADYFNISQKFKCSQCLNGINTKAVYLQASKNERLAFAKSLESSFGVNSYYLTLNDIDPRVSEAAAYKLSPELGSDIYTLAFNKNKRTGLAALNNLHLRSNPNYSKIIIAAIQSKYSSVRKEIHWNIPYQNIEDDLLLSLLQSPHRKKDFKYIQISDRLNENNSSEVFLHSLRSLNQKERLIVGEKIRSHHSNEVFSIALQFNNNEVNIARNAAERLSKKHSPELFKIALSHSDYFVRSGATRRLDEVNLPSLFKIALTDKDPRIRWAASNQLNQLAGPENFKLALHQNQPIIVRRNAAYKMYQTIDSSIKNMALTDPDPSVRSAARKTLDTEE